MVTDKRQIMRLLSIDYGEKRVGAAFGDSETKVVIPLKGLTRKKRGDDIAFVRALAGEYEPSLILIGQPLNMDGSESRFSRMVEKFANRLRIELGLKVQLIDERLSSFEAEEMLDNYRSGLKRDKNLVDSISAMVILKRYLGDI